MTLAFEHDRIAQHLVACNPEMDPDEAAARLERATLVITVGQDAAEPWVQAALLALARCGRRMFRGGVFVQLEADAPLRVHGQPVGSLAAALRRLGTRTDPPPEAALPIHLGVGAPLSASLVCHATGWTGIVGPPLRVEVASRPGNAVSGVLAAAMALTEAFRIAVLGDVRAGRLVQRLSAWGPGEEDIAPQIINLPQALWLVGLGNLGQALMFTLSLLPFEDPAMLRLLLQDFDVAAPENLAVQLLTEHAWIGEKKVRALATWAEDRGFQTTISELPFQGGTRPGRGEPRIALVGVDNLPTRRLVAAAEAGFDLVIDAGLGATAVDAFDLRLHAFPGARTPEAAWPELPSASAEITLSPGLERAVRSGRLDRCGAMMIAGKAVGVPSTALAAAAVQVGQLCRALSTNVCCDLIDASLVDTRYAEHRPMMLPIETDLAFVRAASV